MNSSVQKQKEAVILRREGHSYTDIAHKLKVSRASVCGWVKNVRLSELEKATLAKNLKNKTDRARLKAKITIKTRKVYKEKVAYDTAEKDFHKLSKDPFFMYGIGLWGFERPKKERTSYTFSAPNQKNAEIMLEWMEKYLGISQKTIKLRVIRGKMGESVALTLSKIGPVRTLLAWQKLIMLYYS